MTSKKKKEYFRRIYKNIEENGFHTTYVMEEDNFTPFGYSTGIYKNFKIPEIFISGLPVNLTGELIKNYADKYKSESIPLDKKITGLTDRFSVYFIKVTNDSLNEYILSSIKYYEGSEYEYIQLIFPDLNGRFPNEIGYNYDQKIFGKLELNNL